MEATGHVVKRLKAAHVKEYPLDTVMAEGGPLHVRDQGTAYLERLGTTGRAELAGRFAPHA